MDVVCPTCLSVHIPLSHVASFVGPHNRSKSKHKQGYAHTPHADTVMSWLIATQLSQTIYVHKYARSKREHNSHIWARCSLSASRCICQELACRACSAICGTRARVVACSALHATSPCQVLCHFQNSMLGHKQYSLLISKPENTDASSLIITHVLFMWCRCVCQCICICVHICMWCRCVCQCICICVHISICTCTSAYAYDIYMLHVYLYPIHMCVHV